MKELLEQNETSPLTLRLALLGLLPLDDSVSFHQQKILTIHFPCAALSVLQGNRNQNRSPWYIMDFRILTAVTSQRLLYRLRKKSKLLKTRNVLFRVKSLKSVSPTSVALTLCRGTHTCFISHTVGALNRCHAHESVFAGHSQLFAK